MVDTIWPANAVAGAPLFSGRMIRQAGAAAFGGATAARPLGARSGVRPGTSVTTVTATATEWTCGPFAGVADLESAAEAGPYGFAFDAAATGAVVAASAAGARVDIVYVQLDDPSEADGSAVPAVTRKYLAGVAAASPVAPATPARSFVVARINVPVSGGGAPTVSWVAPYVVSAGGILPVASSVEYPAGVLAGTYLDDAALGALVRWNGTAWVAVGAELSANVTTFGANWSATAGAGHVPRLFMVGRVVTMTGAVTLATGGSPLNMLTVPVAFRPPNTATRFIGCGTTSTGVAYELALAAGVVSFPTGYNTAPISAGAVLPLASSWIMD